MLGYVLTDRHGAGDPLLAMAAARLAAGGWRLAGAVQVNRDHAQPGRACHMDLTVLGTGQTIRISADLGPLSQGCRLDAGALETAAGWVAATLDQAPRLLFVNKFGKQEAAGRGFRPLIGQAMAAGLPVVTAVSAGNMAAFQAFAGGMEQEIGASVEAVVGWCKSVG
jgi:hypothetical protein